MADFNTAFDRTNKFEGGYQCNPDDNGNWTGGSKRSGNLVGTNHGVTAPLLSAYLGRTASVADMKNLSIDTAMKIYKKNYWDQVRGDEIADQTIANRIYDKAVNMGVGTAIIIAKRDLGIAENTHLDNETLKLLNELA